MAHLQRDSQDFERLNLNGISDLESEGCVCLCPENIRLYKGNIQVSARWLSGRFSIPYHLLETQIQDIAADSFVMMSIYTFDLKSSELTLWVDRELFIQLSGYPHLNFSTAARDAVLNLLGGRV